MPDKIIIILKTGSNGNIGIIVHDKIINIGPIMMQNQE